MKTLYALFFLLFAVSAHAVTLTWTDQSDNEDGFRVERYQEPGVEADVDEAQEFRHGASTNATVDNSSGSTVSSKSIAMIPMVAH